MSPSEPGKLYAGTVAGIFRSFDSGRTWSGPSASVPGNIYCLFIEPSASRTVFAGADNGLYRSDDAGTTWTRTLTFRVVDIVADPRNNGILYLGSDGNGVFRSSDRGTSWIRSLIGDHENKVYSLALDPRTPNTIYAATVENTGLSGHVFRSDDAAATWKLVSDGLPAARPEGIVVDPITPARVYVAFDRGDVFRSDDRGGTWHPFVSNLDSYTLTSLAIDSEGSTLYATSRGVFSLDLAGLRAPASAIRRQGLTRTLSPRP